MMQFRCDPPIPARKVVHAFTQSILLQDGDHRLGRLLWNALDPSQGVVQIVELWVDPTARRGGHGHRLLLEMIEQAKKLHRLREQKLRRIWIGVGHKTHVVGRSFLTREGFHHIGSSGGILTDEDLLIYVKSLD